MGLFVAEGPKVINELLTANFDLEALYTTEEHLFKETNKTLVSSHELKKISFLKNANNSVALFKIPPIKPLISNTLSVALDAVRDPGNLGTIIRLCDWFGIQQIICSEDTVDCYNPKVIQATMGSISRVAIHYTHLPSFLKQTNLPVYGGCMEGDSIYKSSLPKEAIIVLGNEANGISNEVLETLQYKISIPRFGNLQETESLNVATATAILLSEFKRATEM